MAQFYGADLFLSEIVPRGIPVMFWAYLGSLFCLESLPGVAVALPHICLIRWEATDAGGHPTVHRQLMRRDPGETHPQHGHSAIYGHASPVIMLFYRKRAILEPYHAVAGRCIKCAARPTLLHEGITLPLRGTWPPSAGPLRRGPTWVFHSNPLPDGRLEWPLGLSTPDPSRAKGIHFYGAEKNQ